MVVVGACARAGGGLFKAARVASVEELKRSLAEGLDCSGGAPAPRGGGAGGGAGGADANGPLGATAERAKPPQTEPAGGGEGPVLGRGDYSNDTLSGRASEVVEALSGLFSEKRAAVAAVPPAPAPLPGRLAPPKPPSQRGVGRELETALAPWRTEQRRRSRVTVGGGN